MQPWSGFYTVMGGAAATLLGLLFIAVSINAATVLNETYGNARRLAEQAFQNYISVLSVSLLALFPSFSLVQFGYVILSVTTLSGVWVLVRFYQLLTEPHDGSSRFQTVRRQITSLIGFGMLLFSAWHMAVTKGDSRNLIAASTIVLLFAATNVSWELLIKIAKAKQAGSGDFR